MNRAVFIALAAALSTPLVGCVHTHDDGDGWYGPYDAGFVPDAARPSGDGRRVPPGCDRVVGVAPDEVFAADVIPVGVLLPETGAVGAVGLSMTRAALLAAREIEALGPVGGHRIAAVVCDTGSDPERAAELAAGLIYDLGVFAIVGPALSASATRIADDGLYEHDVLFVSPSATSPALAALDDRDRLWQTAPSDARLGTAIGRDLAGSPARVITLVAATDPRSAGVADAIAPAWCGGPCPVGALRRLDYADGAAPVGLTIDDADAVVVVMSPDAAARLVTRLQGHDGPIHVDDGLRDPDRLAALPTAVAARLVGVSHRLRGDDARFVAAYTAAVGDPPGIFAPHAYDAMYLVAHASLAAGARNVGGDALAARLRRMSAGDPIGTGPGAFIDGQRLLTDPRAGVFDAIGASGPLDFDRSGQAPAAVDRWRWIDGALVDDGVALRADE